MHEFYIILILFFLLRLGLSFSPPQLYDYSAFVSWTERLNTIPINNFYSDQVFTNNPVGFLYILWIIGYIHSHILTLDYNFLIKLPINIADMLTGFIIFFLIRKEYSKYIALAGFLMYVLNPAILFNTTVFGQYDGIATLFITLSLAIIVLYKKPEISTAMLAIALTLKPQAISFAPFYALIILFDYPFKRWLTSAIAFIATILIIYFPFFPKNTLYGIIFVNTRSLSGFDCTTCFAFNFWGVFGNGLFSKSDMNPFLGIPLLWWGIIILIVNYVLIFGRHFTNKFSSPNIYLTISVSMLAFFTFITRMHERYLLYFFPFLLLAAISIRSKTLIIFYFFISFVSFLNIYLAYTEANKYLNLTPQFTHWVLSNFQLFSVIEVICFIFLLRYYLISFNNKNENKIS